MAYEYLIGEVNKGCNIWMVYKGDEFDQILGKPVSRK